MPAYRMQCKTSRIWLRDLMEFVGVQWNVLGPAIGFTGIYIYIYIFHKWNLKCLPGFQNDNLRHLEWHSFNGHAKCLKPAKIHTVWFAPKIVDSTVFWWHFPKKRLSKPKNDWFLPTGGISKNCLRLNRRNHSGLQGMDGRCKALVCEASASPFHGDFQGQFLATSGGKMIGKWGFDEFG